jgi:hypothetical protein
MVPRTWKSNFRTRFAKEYMPTFFPSGLPSRPTPFRFVLLSVKHIVNALCIDSAVPSTNVFRVSPWSTLVTFRSRRVRSGLLSSIMASFARPYESWIAAGRTTIPYCEFDNAVMHALHSSLSSSRGFAGCQLTWQDRSVGNESPINLQN